MPFKFPLLSMLHLIKLLASLVIILGLSVIVGWISHNLTLIQVDPTFVPMQFNTALGFLVAGINLLNIMFQQHNRSSVLLGAFCFLLGFLTLFQYVSGSELHIDQLFIKHYVDTNTSHPGRMAPNTALCFMLCGIAYFVCFFAKNKANKRALVGNLGILITVLGTVAFGGYLTDVDTAYGWGAVTQMAVHTAIGFILIGISFFLLALHQSLTTPRNSLDWLAGSVAISGIFLTIASWQALESYEKKLSITLEDDITFLASDSLFLIGLLTTLFLTLLVKGATSKTQSQQQLIDYKVPWSVLIIGVALSLTLLQIMHVNFKAKVKLSFDAAVLNYEKSLKANVIPFIDALYDIRTAHLAYEYISQRDFKFFTSRDIQKLPGLIYLEWAPAVYLVDRLAFETKVSERLDSSFNIYELNPTGSINLARNRDLYFPLLYVEPLNNMRMLGYDIASTPSRRKILQAAIDNNQVKSTGRLARFQPEKTEFSVALNLPIYHNNAPINTIEERRNAIKGFVVATIDVDKYINHVLLNNNNPDISFSLEAQVSPKASDFLYRYQNGSQHNLPQPFHLSENSSFKFADRTWQIFATTNNSKAYPRWSWSVAVLPSFILMLVLILSLFLRRTVERNRERVLLLDEVNSKKLHFSALVDTIPGTVYSHLLDENQTLTFVSNEVESLTGYSPEELINNKNVSIHNFIHPEDIARVLTSLDTAVAEHKSYREEFRVIHKNGDIHCVLARGKAIYDNIGDALIIHGTALDITSRKHLESELLREKKKAEESTIAKSEFLANMSHEIRTPINSIMGMSYLTLKTELTLKQKNYTEKVHRSAKALLGIIDDILDFSKIEAGKLTLEIINFELGDTLDDLASVVGNAAEIKGLELLFDVDTNVPQHLIGDSLRLGQILINLTNNAIKFTEQGEVIVSIKVLSNSDTGVHLSFSVTDTGIGISKEQQITLFQSFSQADSSTTRKHGGTGLGLAISKRLTALMGGDLTINSTLGHGTSFTFDSRFPLNRDLPPPAFLTETSLGILKVLVVDNNDAAREILTSILLSFGFMIDECKGSKDAITLIENATPSQPYHLVIIDCKMPEMDGIEATRTMQSSSNNERIPVCIMVTADGRDDAINASKDVGINSFLTKPITPSTLFDSIMQAMGKAILTPNRQDKLVKENKAWQLKLQGAKILLVEDNKLNQELALELLTMNDIKVDVAENGQQAIAMVQRKDYDGVLMDCQMPIMDGYTATRALREDGKFQHLPIIAMTANAMVGDYEKALESGMNDHIAKPIIPETMFKIMAKWIKPNNTIQTEDLNHSRHKQPELVSEPQVELPKSSNEIDIDNGLLHCQGNRTLYKKLLFMFSNNQQNFLGEYNKSLLNDKPSCSRLVHSLKGVAGSLGFSKIYLLSKNLEVELNEGMDDTLIKNHLSEIDKEIKTVIKQVKPFSIGSHTKNIEMYSMENNAVYETLTLLQKAINDFDTDAITILKTLMSIEQLKSFTDEFQYIEELLECYDFNNAKGVISTVIESFQQSNMQ